MNKLEKEIQDCVGRNCLDRQHDIVCFNFSSAGFQECDVISVSKSGFIYEYEIKTSRADFGNDFRNKASKHERMENRHLNILKQEWQNVPNYFAFVCPTGIIPADKLPDYAGLYYYKDGYLLEVFKPPRLHNEYITMKILIELAKKLCRRLIYGCSYTEWQEKQVV